MRHSGDWMTLVDDRVLEFIRENESGSPTEMMRNGPIRYSRQYISRRCKKLADEGLLSHLGNGVYVITEEGEAYLDGRYDTQHWEYVDGDDVTEAGSDADAGSRADASAPAEDRSAEGSVERSDDSAPGR